MSNTTKTAYITGGASGLGKAVAEMLAARGVNLIIADINVNGIEKAFASLKEKHGISLNAYKVDVSSWDQQVSAWLEASKDARIDYVFPFAGVGEKPWVKNDPDSKEYDYEEPNLTTIDIDLKGVLYTCSLAIQHLRRQNADSNGIRGKIIPTASVCGFYCVPTLPIYTAAKHGVVGFTRSYGKHLAEEGIYLNAICPNIVATNISRPEFYEKVKDAGILVPIENVVAAVETLIADDNKSAGECIEVGPRETQNRPAQAPMDEASKLSLDMLHERARPLHIAKT